MLITEFLELTYMHFIYKMDSYFIAVLLVVVIFELIRIRRKLSGLKCTERECDNGKED